MNKEIEVQYDAVLNYSTLTNLRKLENELLTTRCLLINYHNICFNLKQVINEIREYIDKHKLDNRYNFKSLINADDILQIIDKVGGNE